MSTRVRSFSKINLGLAIGPVRGDGFHALTTMYQTLALHDVVTVSAKRAAVTAISLTTNDARVPVDGRNTAWKMVAGCLARLGMAAEVEVHIEKRLPVQGGMGAGSANAAAALLGLERELGVALGEAERLELAATVGSDVPLFLIGGAVLGVGRGELVTSLRDFAAIPCVVAVPGVGVSTPAAFRDWDAVVARGERFARGANAHLSDDGTVAKMGHPELEAGGTLTSAGIRDRLEELSLVYSSLSVRTESVKAGSAKTGVVEPGASGIVRGDLPEWDLGNKQGSSDRDQDGMLDDLAENALLALVRTGIGDGLQNDFEAVVFPQYPSLRETKRQLMGSDSGSPALYAALSGSGSALFGLYRSMADARAAQQRVQASGVEALLTATLPRDDYWRRMFAE
ncbi:4-(cytidine 5'-diphospho)-2-C-methyl-D-erythritol kinase [Granulicella arctica]|uniref:4-diphosphocytidyl-2-C-methyl-D-erythritol kinase n=1 Tax=Granulicella arctica TaxID=940613 RepID=A0A7Y9TF48_9BACT|nr:4-(cytidine 5'-diphospho)-2-C-methyl-D-erythritol kinase [Granulicella arctica]NYF78356.1 4-diphosphocytidyl-2-C-methyl-D-erythritol kinase [Granulicella arctica]